MSRDFSGKYLRATSRYTQLVEVEGDEYHSASARTVSEATKLIEQYFDYVRDVDGVKLLRSAHEDA